MSQHLFADAENGSEETFFRSAAWNATQLSLSDPSIFPIPHSAPAPTPPSMPSNCQALVPNLEVRMHPPAPPAILPPHAKDRPFPTNPSDVQWAREVLSRESQDYSLACEEARRNVANDPRSTVTETKPGDDITVTTLGTGSAIPSKYRNVSATHLDIPGVNGVLLDCGEGSLGQLRRRFGPEGTRRILEELRMIYISHMHADHHLGLNAILREKVKVSPSHTRYTRAKGSWEPKAHSS
jgi:ribonuclease Z